MRSTSTVEDGGVLGQGEVNDEERDSRCRERWYGDECDASPDGRVLLQEDQGGEERHPSEVAGRRADT